ncbi:XP_014769674.1PREDICTED: uncharacterized protein LOC106868767 [Octopus vulgaris]|uniref:XP_014769674.1PREDICTED: uncharacterized protein LOC106868767 n=2 Tax=Octopus TaxID=6643 RepID=A0AA36BT74_OCTVU|nr:XP_014769674.1PREDICTED: uncharacterized protein LOC106868767 [Octopus vulgaris]
MSQNASSNGPTCDLMKFFGLSSLIYTINVTILLIIAISTDYWEYRGFDFVRLFRVVSTSNRTKIIVPRDTNSYLQILYFYPNHFPNSQTAEIPTYNVTFYQSPILVRKYYYNYTNTPEKYLATTEDSYVLDPHLDMCEIVIYLQYGNLFRDCEDLENPVRDRLGIRPTSKERCESFVFSEPDKFIANNTPAVSYLEIAAFSCAILCMTSILIGLTAGAVSECLPSHESFVVAATAPLIAAMMLTSAIGLFHGKCHLLQRLELLPGESVPFKKLFQESRTYSHGWSFVLAWICVVLCLVNSFVWLNKGQNSGYLPYRGGFGYGADKYQYTPPLVPKSVIKRRESIHRFLSRETIASLLYRTKSVSDQRKDHSNSSINTDDKRFYPESYAMSDDRALISSSSCDL